MHAVSFCGVLILLRFFLIFSFFYFLFIKLMTCVHADLDLDSRGFIDAPCGAPDPNLICPHFHLSLYVHGPQRLLWKVWVLSVLPSLCHRSKCWTNTCFWRPSPWCTSLTSRGETTSGERTNGKALGEGLSPGQITAPSHVLQIPKPSFVFCMYLIAAMLISKPLTEYFWISAY